MKTAYTRYRWFYTSRKTLVIGGKSAQQNDELLHEVLAMKKEFYVLHTSEPGSPFCVIMKEKAKVTDEERYEAAVFTGCFSRAWKQRKSTTIVDEFSTSHLSKGPGMKAGMWRVRGEIKRVKVPLELALTVQQKTLRAVPLQTASRPLMRLAPGTIDKTAMSAQLGVELGDSFTYDDILAALPAGGVKKKL